jgi:hypothetical protein
MIIETWKCTGDEYHADRRDESNSTLEVFRKSWKDYRDVYVKKTRPVPAPTKAQILGIAAHVATFEPGDFDRLYTFRPDVDRRTKAGKLEWQAFQESLTGQTVLSAEDYDAALRMAHAVRHHPVASMMLDRDHTLETALRWTDPESGVSLKCRPDSVNEVVHWDLKTSKDPSPASFARDFANLGYHRQFAMYLSGIWLKYGKQVKPRVVAVRSSEPFDVAVYDLDDGTIQAGMAGHRKRLADLAACLKFDQWEQYPTAMTLSLPLWCKD